ncbi:hypothetical protein ES708_04973 [subsurface metagenome]
MLYLEPNEEITNSKYQKLNDVSKPTVTRELLDLVEKVIIERKGRTGQGIIYTLKGSKGSQTAQKGLIGLNYEIS